MGEPVVVDVVYRGMPLLGTVTLRDLASEGGRWVGFVAADAPLPVGTPLSVLTPDGGTLGARVARVVELAGGGSSGGMALAFEASAEAALRRLAGEPTTVPVEVPDDAATMELRRPADDPPAIAGAPAAAPEGGDAPPGDDADKGGGKKKGRRRKNTALGR